MHGDVAVGYRHSARAAQQIDQINFRPLTGDKYSLGLLAPEHEGLPVAASCDTDLLDVVRQSGQVIEQQTTVEEMAGCGGDGQRLKRHSGDVDLLAIRIRAW